MAQALARRGWVTNVVSQHYFEANIEKLAIFDKYVFHRPLMSEVFGEFLEKWRGSGRIIADYDDFIFDVRFSHLTPAHRFNASPLSRVARYVAGNATACRYFSHFTLSTQPLADRVNLLFNPSNVAVISNTLGSGFQGLAKLIRQRVKTTERPFRFGYFSGTATHIADFALIASSVATALTADPSAKMLIIGPMSLPEVLHPFARRIFHRPALVPFYRLPAAMAQVETVLAPLEITEFTTCKSGLKFFEAVAVGCNVVATPIPDIDRFSSPLLRKCHSLDEWSEALQTPFECTGSQIETEIERILAMVDANTLAADWESLVPR